MSNAIGFVKSLSGLVQAKMPDGTLKTLKVGDMIYANMEIISGENGLVTVMFENNSSLTINKGESAVLDESVYQGEGFDNQEVQALQQALLNGEDVNFDATAAGAGADGGAGGATQPFIAGRTGDTGSIDTHNLGTNGFTDEGFELGTETNQPPVAFPDFGFAVEEGTSSEYYDEYDAPVQAVGNLLANDTDDGKPIPGDLDVQEISFGQDSDATVDGDGNLVIDGLYGTLVVNAETGEFTYTVDEDNPDVDAMNEGDTVQEVFGYVVTDGELTDDSTLTITINGKNDAPDAVADFVGGEATSSVVAIFDNAAYVDTSGGISAESDNIQASVLELGYDTNVFTDETPAGFEAALANAGVLLMPENESYNQYTDLAQGAQDSIVNYVNDGGTLVMSWGSGGAIPFLNQAFGFNMSSGGTGTSYLQGSADGTPFESGPESIPNANATDGVLIDSLPEGAQVIYMGEGYGDEGFYGEGDGFYGEIESDGVATVFVIQVGEGTIVFLGYDWFDAAPVGSQDGGWIDVLDSALSYGAGTSNFIGIVEEGNDIVDDSYDQYEAGLVSVSGNVLENDTDVDNEDYGDDMDDGTLDHTYELTVVGVESDNTENVADDDAKGADFVIEGEYGTLYLNEDGSYEYVLDNTKPNVEALVEGQIEYETFTYSISDNEPTNPKHDDATLTIQINGKNDAPVVVADTAEATAVESASDVEGLAIISGNVLANDSDVDDGDMLDAFENELTVFAVSSESAEESYSGQGETSDFMVYGKYGILYINEDGSYDYVLQNEWDSTQSLIEGEAVTDVFAYTASDNHDEGNVKYAESTLTINITGTNDAPVAVDDAKAGISEEGTDGGEPYFPGVDEVTGNVLANDSDVDDGDMLDSFDNELTVTGIESNNTENESGDSKGYDFEIQGEYGTLFLNDDGTYKYVLDNDADNVEALNEGDTVYDVFTYTVSDNHIGADGEDYAKTDTAELSISITGTNDAPVAEGEKVITNIFDSDVLEAKLAAAVVMNDSDVDNDLDANSVTFNDPLSNFGFGDTMVTKTESSSDNGQFELNDTMATAIVFNRSDFGAVNADNYEFDNDDLPSAVFKGSSDYVIEKVQTGTDTWGKPIYENVPHEDDDFVKVSLIEGEKLILDVDDGHPDASYQLSMTVYDSAGNVIGSSDPLFGDPHYSFTADSDGDYYIKLNSGHDSGDYELRMSIDSSGVQDTIDYTITDDGGLSDDATVVIDYENATDTCHGLALDGTDDAEIIIGSDDDLTIDGKGGADTIIAGAGDDTIIYDSNDVSIDGGEGHDTVYVPNGEQLDFSNLSNVEVIDMVNLQADNVSVTAEDVFNVTDDQNTLTIKGMWDTVDVDASLVKDVSASDAAHGYDIYKGIFDGQDVTLIIQDDIDVV